MTDMCQRIAHFCTCMRMKRHGSFHKVIANLVMTDDVVDDVVGSEKGQDPTEQTATSVLRTRTIEGQSVGALSNPFVDCVLCGVAEPRSFPNLFWNRGIPFWRHSSLSCFFDDVPFGQSSSPSLAFRICSVAAWVFSSKISSLLCFLPEVHFFCAAQFPCCEF